LETPPLPHLLSSPLSQGPEKPPLGLGVFRGRSKGKDGPRKHSAKRFLFGAVLARAHRFPRDWLKTAIAVSGNRHSKKKGLCEGCEKI